MIWDSSRLGRTPCFLELIMFGCVLRRFANGFFRAVSARPRSNLLAFCSSILLPSSIGGRIRKAGPQGRTAGRRSAFEPAKTGAAFRAGAWSGVSSIPATSCSKIVARHEQDRPDVVAERAACKGTGQSFVVLSFLSLLSSDFFSFLLSFLRLVKRALPSPVPIVSTPQRVISCM